MSRDNYPLAVEAARRQDPSFNDIIRERIDSYLKRHGLSLNAFAEQTDVRQSVLHRFMTGEQDNIRLDTAQKLCRRLGLVLRPQGEQDVSKVGC